MIRRLIILLLIVGCEEVLDPDTTAPTVVITYPVNNSTLDSTATVTVDANYDCESVCGGDKLLDNCEVCDADTSNDCPADCNGD